MSSASAILPNSQYIKEENKANKMSTLATQASSDELSHSKKGKAVVKKAKGEGAKDKGQRAKAKKERGKNRMMSRTGNEEE